MLAGGWGFSSIPLLIGYLKRLLMQCGKLKLNIKCYSTLKSTTTRTHSHSDSSSRLIGLDQPRLSFG